MTPRKEQRKINGNAGPHKRPNGSGSGLAGVNGHGSASTELGGTLEQRDRATSDHGTGAIVAGDANSVAAPGTVRDGRTKAAPLRPNGHLRAVAAEKSGSKIKTEPIPGGEFSLPDHPDEFVHEIHRRIDLFEVWLSLLRAEDEKIRQRTVEKLTEMRYKGAAAMADEPQSIIIDMPGPERERQ
jgi:hypothetical protein